jgi:exopolyphosphatase/pppGpp-phosphohydrolase
MQAAARLHAIGAGLDAKSPQKAARKHLKAMTLPPGWSETEREIMVNVVRYHRGGLPSAENKSFGRFRPEEQKLIATLSGLLRFARSLAKCGVLTAQGLRVEKSVDALIIRVPGLEESEANAARLATGKYLLESSVALPVIVKAGVLSPKVVELPKKEEPPQAAASD